MKRHIVKPLAQMIALIVSIALISACGPAVTAVSPTSTAVPPSPTATPITAKPTEAPATATPLPPTATMAPEPSPTATAQPTPTATPPAVSVAWQQTYRVNGSEVVHDVLMAEDGGYYLVGTANLVFDPEQNGDVYLVRTDAAGKKLWEKTYGGDRFEEGNTILPTNDGQLMIIGYTASFDASGIDVYMIKVDHDGNELWSKTFGGSLDEMGGGKQMPDGGFILGGNVVDPNDIVADPGAAGYAGYAGRSNIFIARTDGDGNELWTQTFGGAQNVIATTGVQSPDGGFVILASIIAYPEPGNHIYLLKVDENGQEVWSRTWAEDDASGYALVQTSDGGYLLTGPYLPPGSEKEDFLFIKTDAEGNEVWRSTFGDPDMIDYAVVLTEAADGGYVAAGESVKDYYSGDSDMSLVKIDAQGQLVWQEKIETNAHHMLARILQHLDGGYVIATSIVSSRDFEFDIMLIKIGAPTSSTTTDSASAGIISANTATQVKRLRTLNGRDNRLYGLAFSPDGRFFASSSLDGAVQVWDRASWQLVQEFTVSRVWGWRLFFLTDSIRISSGNGTVWDATTGKQVHTLNDDNRVAFSPDGVWMAVNGRGQATVELWRIEDWQTEREIVTNHTGDIFTLVFSPDSRLLATAANISPDDPEFTVKLWDVTTGQELFTLQGHQDAIHGVAFSPDSRWLASASMDTTVKLWDVQTGQLLHTLQTQAELFDVAVSPDGSLVAAALNNKTVEL
jgi:WD40 repeat protein